MLLSSIRDVTLSRREQRTHLSLSPSREERGGQMKFEWENGRPTCPDNGTNTVWLITVPFCTTVSVALRCHENVGSGKPDTWTLVVVCSPS